MSPGGQSRERTVAVRIAIPRGSRSKYEYDTPSGQLRLKQVLSSSVHYPVDYGFILDTIGRDGDELDVLLLTEEPAVPGSIQEARPVGVLDMADRHGVDHKVLAVPASDPRFNEIASLADIAEHWRVEIKTFFDTYHLLDGKNPEIRGWRDVDEAWRVIQSAQRAKKTKRKR
jgi:inorganic pyrophosphatase